MATNLRFLRPFSFHPLPAGSSPRSSAYLRFYELARTGGGSVSCRRKKSTLPTPLVGEGTTTEEWNKATSKTLPDDGKGTKPKQRNNSAPTPRTTPDVEDYKPEQRSALVAARIRELGPAGGLEYPRYTQAKSMRIAQFNNEFSGAGTETLENQLGHWTISGMLPDEHISATAAS